MQGIPALIGAGRRGAAAPPAGWAVVASGSNSAAVGSATVTLDTTGANFILIVSMDYFDSTGVVNDNKGNTVSLAVASLGAFTQLRIRYIQNPTVGTGHTFTDSLATNNNIIVVAWSGANTTSVLDQTNSAAGVTPGSITPTQDNELVVAAVADYDNGDSWTVNASFNIQILENAHLSNSNATLIQTSAAAANPTFTLTGSGDDQRSAIASFKAA